jgi:hypothetical protein
LQIDHLDAIRTSAHAIYRASQWLNDGLATIGEAINDLWDQAMNDENLLSQFFERVDEIVASSPEGEWDTLIRRAFPESLVWDGYVASTVEALCGGDVRCAP